jgi:hypothetical protein
MKSSSRPPISAAALPNPARGSRQRAALFTVLLLAASAVRSAPLSETTAVLTRPDPSAPAITFLSAGTDPAPAPSDVAAPPEGWQAVNLPGPFEAYVENKNLNKALDVIPGSLLWLAPKAGAGVLAIAQKGDPITITGLRGKWTQLRLERSLIGYIHPGPMPAAGSAQALPQPGPETAPNYAAMPPPSAAQAAPPEPPTTAPGKPAAEGASDQGAGILARTFEGRFVSTKHLFSPQRPYDWQLNDASGARTAYLDVGKLLLTDQIDKYAGHDVSVYGAVKPVPGTADIVVVIESLQLR